MKKLIPILIIVLLVSLILVSTVFAGPGIAVGRCKRGYKLESLANHQGESASLFLNPAQDKNGDGYICAQYYYTGLHRHLDNFNSSCKKR
jgi:cell division protein FtsW (lipid II flippase)